VISLSKRPTKRRFQNSVWTICLVLTAIVFLEGSQAYAFKEGDQNCAKCHQLSNSDATSILGKLNLGSAKILGIQMSPIKGLWEVAVENNGQRFVVYIDFSRKFVSPGPFIDFANRKDITRDRIEALNKDRKVDLSKLSLENALIVGKADAPTKVVVFTDPG
jgi:thiol:disulfide interchange protein DsbC